MKIPSQSKTRFLMKNIKGYSQRDSSPLVLFPYLFSSHLFPVTVLVQTKCPCALRCVKWPESSQTRSDHQPTNPLVQLHWRKPVRAKGRHHGVPCPGYLRSWRGRSRVLPRQQCQLWFSRNTTCKGDFCHWQELQPSLAWLKRQECGSGGRSRSAGRSPATPWATPLDSRLQSLWS